MSIRSKKERFMSVLDDCNQLLDRLEAKKPVNFSIFAEVWREMKFSLIFCGIKTKAELIEFCDEALMAAKSCWLPPNDGDRRLLSGFLVYGMFFKQPCRSEVRYKITAKNYADIKEYCRYIKSKHLTEHLNMFVQLFDANAFVYTAVDIELPLYNHSQRKDAEELKAMVSGKQQIAQKDPELVDFIMNQIVNVIMPDEEAYNRTLNVFKDCRYSSFDHVSKGTMDMVSFKLRNLCFQRNISDLNEEPVKKSSKNKGEKPVSAIGNRRRLLKNMSYSNKGKTAIETAVNNDTVNDGVNDGFENECVPLSDNDQDIAKSGNDKIKKGRRRRQRGFRLTQNFKQHRHLIGAPTEGMYDAIHTVNNRTLYQKVLPKKRNNKSNKKGGIKKVKKAEDVLNSARTSTTTTNPDDSTTDQWGHSSTAYSYEPVQYNTDGEDFTDKDILTGNETDCSMPELL